MSDFDIDWETPCPHCKHSITHYRECSNIFCEDGLIASGDCVNQMYYEYSENCEQCHGSGFEHWCPNCGKEILEDQSNE